MEKGKFLFLASFLYVVLHVSGAPAKTEEKPPSKNETFDNILKANKDLGDSLYEGDIVLPLQRNAIRDKTLRWSPLTVPYSIQQGPYSTEVKRLMNMTMEEYSVRTCLNFVERTNEENYIEFEKGGGCYAGVGMSGGRHGVSIGGGCESRGVIIHEVMHALGFWHEQSRTDRDDYVQIVWDVIQDGKDYNFDKYDSSKVDLLNETYDYSSLMHYSATAFSKNGSKTIIGLREGSDQMGQRGGFSRLDLIKLNKLYECEVATNEDGYTDWTGWSPCDIDCISVRKRFCDSDDCSTWGEEEIETTSCDDCTVGYDPDCGPELLTDFTGAIKSPLFPYSYKNNAICTQTIQVPDGFRIKLVFDMLDIENYNGGCYYDYLHIYDGESSDDTKLGTFCTLELPSPVVSSGNQMTIVFQTDSSVVQQGFYARYYITNAPVIQCAFEDEEDYYDWTDDATGELTFQRKAGKTPSADTGPNADHTFATDKGHYLFLESSAPAANGNKARIISPNITSIANKFCFSLWYNMYGINIGTLNVYVMTEGVLPSSPVFSESGDRTNADWYEGKIEIDSTKAFQIVIEGQRYNGFKGDLAIDDVRLDEGPCA